MSITVNRDARSPTAMRRTFQANEHECTAEVFSISSAKTENQFQNEDGRLGEMSRRFSSFDVEKISSSEMLPYLLSFVYSLQEAEYISSQLFSRFGSISAIFFATQQQLADIVPDAALCYTLLKIVTRLIGDLLREPIIAQTVLSRWSDLENYLRHTLAHEQVETVRLLFLNTRNALLKDELH